LQRDFREGPELIDSPAADGDAVSSKPAIPEPASLELTRSDFPSRIGGLSRGARYQDQADQSTFARISRFIGRPLVGVAAILVMTAIFRHASFANVTTVGFTFLLVILIASAVGGLETSIVMSIAATLVYDYYFIPPVDTWNITDPQDWIALSAFITTSVVGSTLSAWARRQTREAHGRRREAEQLYDLSQNLLSAGDTTTLCNAIPADIVESFGAKAAALFLMDGETIFYSPGGSHEIDAGNLKASVGYREVKTDRGNDLSFIPLRMGINVVGSAGIAGAQVDEATLESLGSMLTIAIERARAIEQMGRIEALRESERLKSALLDAITHEFRTPLTAMKISVTGMLSDLDFDREQCRELLSMIDEGCDRIDQLVSEVSEMSRLESGEINLDFGRLAVGDLIEAAMADCRNILGTRPVERGVANADVAIRADLFWAAKVLVHLISNANMYSSPGEPITVRAETKQGYVFISVADRGPGIDPTEIGRIFEKFYRGKEHRCRVQGTGMGLPIAKAIVEAHGGAISVSSKPGEGSVFRFSLPIDRSSEADE
jgi:two-component system, OmpR family, sensor histidine kinase KdpD